MIKRYVLIGVAALSLVACAGDPATNNRDALGTSQTILAAAQSAALNYRARPACPAPVVLCRDAAVYSKMQEMDRLATGANNIAYDALKRDPSATSTKLLVDAALGAIKGFDAFTKESK